jgi:hypothetical protein
MDAETRTAVKDDVEQALDYFTEGKTALEEQDVSADYLQSLEDYLNDLYTTL